MSWMSWGLHTKGRAWTQRRGYLCQALSQGVDVRHQALQVVVNHGVGQVYGKGYQDVQNRLPKISDTMSTLGWAPQVTMEAALRKIFESYREKVAEARALTQAAAQ